MLFSPSRTPSARAAGRVGLAVCLLAVLVPAVALGEPFERSFTFQSQKLVLYNLIGKVEVRGHSGQEFRVAVHVRGDDASEDQIRFEEDASRNAVLGILFPTEEHTRYVYPELEGGRKTSFTMRPEHDGTHWFGKLLHHARGDRIEVRKRRFRGAVEMWADVVVEVPKDRVLQVRLGAGSIVAENVEGSLDLGAHAGPIEANGIAGDLLVDTGSGSVIVRKVRGEVHVDTGSGSVEVIDVSDAKRVDIDTGSGAILAEAVTARDLNVDTGSGRVDVLEIEVSGLTIDTGSGSVDADRVSADDVLIDTGSGAVSLDLVRMGRGRFQVDTGSGSIRLDLPKDISADFDVDTGSGSIQAHIEGVRLSRRQRREAQFTVGKGESRVSLSTGSGSIRLSQDGRAANRR